MSPPTTPTSPAPYSNTSRFAPRQVEYLGFAGEQQEVEIVTDPLGQGRLPELRHRRASLDVRGAPLTEVLSFIAHRGGVNIVTDPSLKGEVTMTVRDISLETMLLHVLQAQKLGYERRGRVLVIKPRAEL